MKSIFDFNWLNNMASKFHKGISHIKQSIGHLYVKLFVPKIYRDSFLDRQTAQSTKVSVSPNLDDSSYITLEDCFAKVKVIHSNAIVQGVTNLVKLKKIPGKNLSMIYETVLKDLYEEQSKVASLQLSPEHEYRREEFNLLVQKKIDKCQEYLTLYNHSDDIVVPPSAPVIEQKSVDNIPEVLEQPNNEYKTMYYKLKDQMDLAVAEGAKANEEISNLLGITHKLVAELQQAKDEKDTYSKLYKDAQTASPTKADLQVQILTKEQELTIVRQKLEQAVTQSNDLETRLTSQIQSTAYDLIALRTENHHLITKKEMNLSIQKAYKNFQANHKRKLRELHEANEKNYTADQEIKRLEIDLRNVNLEHTNKIALLIEYSYRGQNFSTAIGETIQKQITNNKTMVRVVSEMISTEQILEKTRDQYYRTSISIDNSRVLMKANISSLTTAVHNSSLNVQYSLSNKIKELEQTLMSNRKSLTQLQAESEANTVYLQNKLQEFDILLSDLKEAIPQDIHDVSQQMTRQGLKLNNLTQQVENTNIPSITSTTPSNIEPE